MKYPALGESDHTGFIPRRYKTDATKAPSSLAVSTHQIPIMTFSVVSFKPDRVKSANVFA